MTGTTRFDSLTTSPISPFGFDTIRRDDEHHRIRISNVRAEALLPVFSRLDGAPIDQRLEARKVVAQVVDEGQVLVRIGDENSGSMRRWADIFAGTVVSYGAGLWPDVRRTPFLLPLFHARRPAKATVDNQRPMDATAYSVPRSMGFARAGLVSAIPS